MRYAFWGLLGVIVMVSAAAAQTATMVRELYCGTFRWDSDQVDQRVLFDFIYPRQAADGFTLLEGMGLYIVADGEGRRLTKIRIIMRLENETGEFEIFERDADKEGFVTDGSHKGKLAADLRRIEAVWTTNGTGEMGRLELEAGTCRLLVS